MTTEHPITPPPELVQQLWKLLCSEDAWDRVIALAYRAGADAPTPPAKADGAATAAAKGNP